MNARFGANADVAADTFWRIRIRPPAALTMSIRVAMVVSIIIANDSVQSSSGRQVENTVVKLEGPSRSRNVEIPSRGAGCQFAIAETPASHTVPCFAIAVRIATRALTLPSKSS